MLRTTYKLLCVFASLCLVDVLLLTSGWALTQEDLHRCEGKGNVTPRLRASACTEVIESGVFSGKDLAAVFNNRGLAYQMSRDYARSIADFDQAIRLDSVR
jgi:hypothetical protein